MSVADLPNKSGRSGLKRPKASHGFVGYIHPGVFIGGYDYSPTQESMKKPATPLFATNLGRQEGYNHSPIRESMKQPTTPSLATKPGRQGGYDYSPTKESMKKPSTPSFATNLGRQEGYNHSPTHGSMKKPATPLFATKPGRQGDYNHSPTQESMKKPSTYSNPGRQGVYDYSHTQESMKKPSATNPGRQGGCDYSPAQESIKRPSTATNPVRQDIGKDRYEISTSGKSLLHSTFAPNDSRKPSYHVTTDATSHNRATTILWRFDPEERKVTEVATITWWMSGKTMVQMSGVQVPVTEFLTKSKWRLGMYSCTHTFTSENEEYMWIPQHPGSNTESCTLQCIIPISRNRHTGSTIIAVYRPSFFREASESSQLGRISKHTKSNSTESSRPRTSESSFFRPRSRHASLSSAETGERVPAVLQMYPKVNSKPRLREIILLTVILVVVQKDEWRNLPYSWANVTTPDVVLSRLSMTHDPKSSSSTLV